MTNYTKINGIKVSYKINLTDSDIYLIFIHGLQTRKEAFEFYETRLKNELNYCTLSIDLVGFGETDKPPKFSYDLSSQVKILISLLSALKIEKIIIIGHSFGGMIGNYLLDYDIEILSFINLEGNMTLSDCGESLNVDNMTFESFKPYYNNLIRELDNSDESAMKFRASSLKMIPNFVFYASSKTIVKWSKSSYLYDKFINQKLPKMLIIGEKSGYSTRPDDKYTTIKTVPKTSHFMFLEEKEKTLQLLLDFLNDCANFNKYIQ